MQAGPLVLRCGSGFAGWVMRLRAAALLAYAISALASGACADGTKSTDPGKATRMVPLITPVSYLFQLATVNRLAPSNPTVRVTDTVGTPLAGINVEFSSGLETWPMLVTGSDGLASVAWRMSQRAGVQTITARLYAADRTPLAREVTFTATALPDTLAAIVAYVGGSQLGFPSRPVVTSPIVVAVDEFANAVAGVEVRFEAIDGGSVTPATVVTDVAGRAAVGAWTLGADIGVDTLIATAGTLKPVYLTAAVVRPLAATSIVSGSQTTCALGSSGDVYCWGSNRFGESNPRDLTPQILSPVRVPLPAKMVSISGGNSHTCAISDEVPPQAYCWGRNDVGQLGSKGVGPGPVKVPVPGGLAVVTAGFDHTCGLTPAGVAYCWGSGTWGQLGNGGTSSCSIPPNGGASQDCAGPGPVSGDLRFVSIAAGMSHTCGIVAGGQMYCWGLNSSGQLGAPSGSPCQDYSDYYYYYYYGGSPVACALAPQPVSGAQTFASAAVGFGTCGLTSTGSAMCFEQYGTVLVTSATFASLTPDANCGIEADGSALCWRSGFDTGAATFSQLAPLESGFAFSAITAVQAHRCGLLQEGGVVMCWGNNDSGQLGNGTQTTSVSPAPVFGPPTP